MRVGGECAQLWRRLACAKFVARALGHAVLHARGGLGSTVGARRVQSFRRSFFVVSLLGASVAARSASFLRSLCGRVGRAFAALAALGVRQRRCASVASRSASCVRVLCTHVCALCVQSLRWSASVFFNIFDHYALGNAKALKSVG